MSMAEKVTKGIDDWHPVTPADRKGKILDAPWVPRQQISPIAGCSPNRRLAVVERQPLAGGLGG
jgi:hypothetical protein